ncbi:MAG: hypothetical protein LKF71_07775 [Oscillospiraceae bacterium]|jgi:cell division protein FtsL|nr:hypothetical protein [Oscillospiraceae bacterium]
MHSGQAYDFDLFEAHAGDQAQQEESQQDNVIDMPNDTDTGKVHKKVRLHRHPLRMAAMCIGLTLMSAVMASFVYGQVQLSELTVQISEADSSLSEQQSLYTQLQMRSDAKHSLASVESAATKQLGMAKVDTSRMETVQMNNSDKVQVLQKTGEDFLSRIWERICELLS